MKGCNFSMTKKLQTISHVLLSRILQLFKIKVIKKGNGYTHALTVHSMWQCTCKFIYKMQSFLY